MITPRSASTDRLAASSIPSGCATGKGPTWLARRSGRPTDEQHQLYTLEGFLARLAQSPYLDQLILEGRVLLAAYDRRPTGDSDAVLELVHRVARLPADDGLTFDTIEAIAHPSNCGDTQQ